MNDLEIFFLKITLKSSQNPSLFYLYTKFGKCKSQVPHNDEMNHEIKEKFALKSKKNISVNHSKKSRLIF